MAEAPSKPLETKDDEAGEKQRKGKKRAYV
jgi:hypothetical protein